jgi:copper chaperone
MHSPLHFKTNLNCNSCVQKVKPLLNAAEFIHNWAVDTNVADKVLTVEIAPSYLPASTPDDVINLIKTAGFSSALI